MKVIIACEKSQEVCKAFRARGHEAYSCDLQASVGGYPEWHIEGDAIDVVYDESHGWDLMICHPPCTYISRAGARWMFQGGEINPIRRNYMIGAVEVFNIFLDAPIKKKCLENPTPLKMAGLPPHSQVIQPYQFGHPYSKRTLLWLDGIDPLTPTDIVTEFKPFLPSNTGGKKRGQKYQYKSISQEESSKTFHGIARAMAEQWG
jgi:hypothetical protein